MLSEEVNLHHGEPGRGQLLYLESQDPDKDIQFYINSPGGSVTDAWPSMTPCSTSSAT